MRAATLIAAIAGFLAILAMQGCARVDADQARQCRSVIPALNPDGTHLQIARVVNGQLPHSVRVDYIVTRGEFSRARHVICLFASSGLADDKAEMVGVATENGPLSRANFYFLRRFYLEAAGEPPRDPGGIPTLLTWNTHLRGFAYLVQQTISGLPSAAVYGLLAASYALIFGLVGRINLAFGQFAALGGAAVFIGVGGMLSGGITTPIAGLMAGLVTALMASTIYGYASGRVLAGPFGAKAGQASLIATVGLSLAMSEYIRLTQGEALHWLPPVWNDPIGLVRAGDFTAVTTPLALTVTALAVATGLCLVALMRQSAFGRAWRAFSDDPRAAALMGIDGRRLLDITFALSCGLAGFGGFVITIFYGELGFADGFSVGLKALVAAVLGGIGSIPGALMGGVLIGLGEAAWSTFMPLDGRDIAVYAVLAIVLIFRPQGLLGRAEETRGVRMEH